MTVTVEKCSFQALKSAKNKYGEFVLPFDHFNNLTVNSRIWKSIPQDRFDFLCGQIALQTEGLHQRMNTVTCSDILAGVRFNDEKSAQRDKKSHLEETSSSCNEFDVPNSNNNSCIRRSTDATAEWFLHPRVQDMVDHQVALMEVADCASFPNLAENKPFIRHSSGLGQTLGKGSSQTTKFGSETDRILSTGHSIDWITYNNSFDKKLTFQGLIPRKDINGCLLNKKNSKSNILVGVENVSTLVEEHTSKYRLYTLALLRESDIPMSPKASTKNRKENCRTPLVSLLQLSSFKCLKDEDEDTTQLVKAFTDQRFEQIWHSDRFDEETVRVNDPTKKKRIDLWDLPRAELPSEVQLSPDSKILLWKVTEGTVSSDNSYSVADAESPGKIDGVREVDVATGLNIQAPVFQPGERNVHPTSNFGSARRRLWEDTGDDDDDNSGCSELNGHGEKRSITDSDIRSNEREPEVAAIHVPTGTKLNRQYEPQEVAHVQSCSLPSGTGAQLHQNGQAEGEMRSQTPDFHSHKHAVVSIKDIEQQIQQPQRRSAYPIDVVCSPFHLSQHIHRYNLQQTQSIQQNFQQPTQPIQQTFQQVPVQPQLQRNIVNVNVPPPNVPPVQVTPPAGHPGMRSPGTFMQAPGAALNVNISPRVQMTYAQVANQQNNFERDIPRGQGQSFQRQISQTPTQVPNQMSAQWIQYQCFQQQQQQNNGVFQKQQQPQQVKNEVYNQSQLLEQHKGEDRSFQQAQAFQQEQLQRETQTQAQHGWSSQPSQQQVYSGLVHAETISNIPNPMVRRLMQDAHQIQSKQPMQTRVYSNQQQQHISGIQQEMFQQQQMPFQRYNSIPGEQIPWNNNNNNDLHAPQPTFNHLPPCVSVNTGVRPEVARIYEPNPQNLSFNHQAHQVPAYPKPQASFSWYPQQQTVQHSIPPPQPTTYSSVPPFEQYVTQTDTVRCLDPQCFMDSASVAYSANLSNHAHMR